MMATCTEASYPQLRSANHWRSKSTRPGDGRVTRPASVAAHGLQLVQQIGHGHRRDRDPLITNSVWDDQPIAVSEAPARIHHVGYIPVTAAVVRPDQGISGDREDPSWFVEIEEDRSDRIGPHRAHPVREDQPSGVCLD